MSATVGPGPLARALLEEFREHPEGREVLAAELGPFLAPAESDRLLGADEALVLLGGGSRDVLIRWAREGRIWAVKVGREWRFRADRLEVVPIDGTPMPPRVAPHRAAARRECLSAAEAMRNVTR